MSSVALFPAMGNRLKELRNSMGWTLERAADEMAVSRSQYIKLERGERRLNADYISKAAQVFGVTAGDIISAPETVPLMGYIGAGGEISPEFEQTPEDGLDQIEVPFSLPGDMIALQVRGISMLPRYDPDDVLIVWREQRRALHTFYGEEAAVKTVDGRRFLKVIERNGELIDLISFNDVPIRGVRLDWIGEIYSTIRASQLRRHARVVDRQGGVQGQLKLKTA